MAKTEVATSNPISYYKKQLLNRLQQENDASRDVVKAIISTAKLLQRIKKEAGHGGWMKLFEDSDVTDLGFSLDKAKRYMTILDNPFLMDSQNWEYLPPSYSALSILAGVPEKRLNKLLKNGGLDYTLSVSDARHLRSESQPKTIEDKSSGEDDKEVAGATKGKGKKSGRDILEAFSESLENLQEAIDDFDLEDFETQLGKFFAKYAKENG